MKTVRPVLELRPLLRYPGLGVFAKSRIEPATRVLRFDGPLLLESEVVDRDRTIQVDADHYRGTSGPFSDHVNHSCSPTCFVRGNAEDFWLITAGAVAPGDELTFDYSTSTLRRQWRFSCQCGTPRCRGLIQPFSRLPLVLQRMYADRGQVPEFIESWFAARWSQRPLRRAGDLAADDAF